MKFGPPTLSAEARLWEARYPSPKTKKQPRCHATWTPPTCEECEGILREDLCNGIMVCHDCGITERILVSENPSYLDVDWHGSSMITKSQHVPIKYLLDLVKKFGISFDVVPELTNRYKAIIFWSDRNKPDGRKSLPN